MLEGCWVCKIGVGVCKIKRSSPSKNDTYRGRQINLPEEGVTKLWCHDQMALSWVATHLASTDGIYQDRTSDDDWTDNLGSYRKRQSLKVCHSRICIQGFKDYYHHLKLSLEPNWKPMQKEQDWSDIVPMMHFS